MMDQGCCRADDRSAHHRYRPCAAGAGHADGPFGLPPGAAAGRDTWWPIVPLGVCSIPHRNGRRYRQRCRAHRRTDQRSERTGCAPTDCRKAFRSESGVTQPPPPRCISTTVARQQYSPEEGDAMPAAGVSCREREFLPVRTESSAVAAIRVHRRQTGRHLGESVLSHGDHCTLRRRVFRLWSG
jgi:hypothetical protein